MDNPADKLAALEREVADLRRLVASLRRPVTPARLSRRQAATVLGCSPRQVTRYAARGLVVRLPGVGKAYFDPENVAALARSEDAAREWVARRKYVPLSKRSR